MTLTKTKKINQSIKQTQSHLATKITTRGQIPEIIRKLMAQRHRDDAE
jgi:hypothetical protein